MKVWIVLEKGVVYPEDTIIAVFSTIEKARDFIYRQDGSLMESIYVDSYEVDGTLGDYTPAGTKLRP